MHACLAKLLLLQQPFQEERANIATYDDMCTYVRTVALFAICAVSADSLNLVGDLKVLKRENAFEKRTLI